MSARSTYSVAFAAVCWLAILAPHAVADALLPPAPSVNATDVVPGWFAPVQLAPETRVDNANQLDTLSSANTGHPVISHDAGPNGAGVAPGMSWENWTSPARLTGNLQLVAVMAALSLAPALLLMTTCYVRLIVVLSLLRQALGSQQLPPNQVTTALAMFLTGLIMWPVWSEVHHSAIEPYTNPAVAMPADEAWAAAVKPVREFMSKQIHTYGNQADVLMFVRYLPETSQRPLETFADVPLQALLPGFMLSELKIAFLIGFQVYLPFVIIDLVVASVTMSMGWVMVPPSTVALPMKLILFVLVDGWHLITDMLLMSFQLAS